MKFLGFAIIVYAAAIILLGLLMGCDQEKASMMDPLIAGIVDEPETPEPVIPKIDGVGRSMEQHFSIDFTALGAPPQALATAGPRRLLRR